MKKVAIIELGNSHTECLPAQIKFLSNASIEVTLILSHRLKERVEYIQGVHQFIFFKEDSWFYFPLLKVRNALANNRYDAVVFNTFHGKRIRKLFLLPLGNQNFTGILHNIKKYKHSRTQKAINKKVHKFFTLAEYLILENNLPLDKSNTFSYFYALNKGQSQTIHRKKSKGEIWIAIPGQVENKRRDYQLLFDQVKNIGLSQRIHLFFLGPCMHAHGDGNLVKDTIAQLGINKQCTLWDGYVPEEAFQSILTECDYILPLIHKEKQELKTYFTYQISGTINIAFGYHKAMLLENAYKNYPDFEEGSIFYERENLLQTINALEKPVKESYTTGRFCIEKQQKSYLELIQK